MAFDEELAPRIRRYFQRKEVAFEEKEGAASNCELSRNIHKAF